MSIDEEPWAPYCMAAAGAGAEFCQPFVHAVPSERVRERKVKMPKPIFIRSRDAVINTIAIDWIDIRDLEAGMIVVHHDGKATEITGSLAVECIMQLKPSALEGKRMKWVRRGWMKHNLLGHPLLMILALLGRVDLGLKIHEATVPRPIAWLGRR